MRPLRRGWAFTLGALGGALGFTVTGLRHLQYKVRLAHLNATFVPRPDDIFISTYPKAGTTWMQMILYQLQTRGRGEFEHILQVAPWYEQLARDGRWRHLESLPAPRLLKTHLLYEQLRPAANARCVYMTRNARDTLISLYHHVSMHSRVNVDFDRVFEQSLRGRPGQPSWQEHLASWWPHRHDSNVLWLRYEDMVKDLEGALHKLSTFCGLPFAEEDKPEILRKCGIDYMRQMSARFDPRFAFYDRERRNTGGFIRKGGVGGVDSHFQERHQQRLDAEVARVRRELGITEAEL
ncbi:sulfotransferase domain-containing protein [Pyxidicoccus parkwayensis]|uniref:Sulfotransferase domain-containing protein n=1 Tax=Pyxidicoccus parkwayensis TaxID=2813578 RepID=A0ABX7NY89_9BACT|nr:sulfotransferase domain-containing protein [Pyxidicoccus parkwaysis]QSQ23765.1 sulfotransferase domain-containing protein [Pyxidicoccus parkwaysis]